MTTLAPGRIWASHPDGTRVNSLADIIRRRAAATPGAAAMIDGDVITTFADLDRRSSQVAQALRASGVQAGDRVAYLGPNAPSFLEVLYGAAKIGAVTTALNNRLALAERQVILRDAQPSVLILGEGEVAMPVGDPASLSTVVTYEEYEGWLLDHPVVDPAYPGDPHDPTLIFYTSGTTGIPKGIMLSGDSLGQALATMHYEMELDTTSVAMAPIPYFHISGLGLAMVANLNGAALLLDMATEPTALVELLVRRRVSHAAVVPTLIQRMVNLPASRDADWSALKYLVYGSAPIPLPVIEEATTLFGCKFLQSYGLTESTGGVTVLWPSDHLPAPGREQQLRSVGRAMPGVQLRVVDPQTLEDVPVGTRGEVLVGGGHLMIGYWRQPEATAEAITADGWLRTGDGGSFDELGYLYLHDRLKDMIVSGGENVFPAEIESALTAHPAIAEVAVIGVPSERWGESPFAVVVLQPGASVTSAELVDWAHERLARFKCPVGFDFVATLPRNASGKLLKNVLREERSTPVG
ncbi:Acyl-CoA synthetase (AMP-forming)/AMP-acid ligase II [Frankineae bacterium MT45]|nr:Acyl-CoA synthetase (AMP-forming)/AMP-acid ligase II [Frankineae bacterium MT45]